MKDTLHIKYEFQDRDGFDLALIGSSFIGFDRVIKEILLSAGISEKVEVRTTSVKQGSVDVVNSIVLLDPTFIQDPRHYIEFLKLAAPELINGFNTFMAAKNTMNDYYAKNPLDFEVTLLVTAYLLRNFRLAGFAKKGDKAMIEASSASPRQIKRIRSMVKRGYFKKALAPITSGNISSVKISGQVQKDKKQSVDIDETNVGDYLPEDAQILPDFIDGENKRITGELQLLGSTHGDSMKIKVRDIDPENNLLDAKLADGLDITNYSYLFKQAVFIDAEIQRRSMYKRPTLVINKMTPLQEQLDI